MLRSGEADIDDVIGDVWLAPMVGNMARLRRYDTTRGSVSGFVAMIATRVAIDRLRQQRVTPVELDDPPERTDDGVEDAERAALARCAIEHLSEHECAFVLRLTYDEEPAEKVAADLGIAGRRPDLIRPA